MTGKSTIIGIGEAVLAEIAGQSGPAGISLEVALAANRLGHSGIAISRLGQDLTANELLTSLVAAGLDISHLQSDPDLPTGRLVVRTVAGTVRRTLQTRAAFDNLQWDFDLVDVAQSADAVVFGMLAQRGGQTQSVIARFLDECRPALRVFDLTNRDDDTFDRRCALARLEHADVVIMDQTAWQQLQLAGDADMHESVVASLLRPYHVAMALHVQAGRRATLNTPDAAYQSQWTYAEETRPAALVGLIHGLLTNQDAARSLHLAGVVAAHVESKAAEALPERWDENA